MERVMNSVYGDAPAITRIEGQGNDGMILDLTQETIDEIMSKEPVGTVIDGDTVKLGSSFVSDCLRSQVC